MPWERMSHDMEEKCSGTWPSASSGSSAPFPPTRRPRSSAARSPATVRSVAHSAKVVTKAKAGTRVLSAIEAALGNTPSL